MPKKRKDIVGQKFNKLTVIKASPNLHEGRANWFCECECRNTITVSGSNIKTTKSCGCSKSSANNYSHTSEYRIWYSMIRRTTKPSCVGYKNYGGRGITVCDRWMKFESFLEDMGPRTGNLSIDRVDNNKGYSPDNCKWATKEVQGRNKRNNRIITINGVEKVFIEWLEHTNTNKSTFYGRQRRGLSDRQSLGL